VPRLEDERHVAIQGGTQTSCTPNRLFVLSIRADISEPKKKDPLNTDEKNALGMQINESKGQTEQLRSAGNVHGSLSEQVLQELHAWSKDYWCYWCYCCVVEWTGCWSSIRCPQTSEEGSYLSLGPDSLTACEDVGLNPHQG